MDVAALMAMEQMSVGSLMHAEMLWKAAVDTNDKEELTSLQNRFVTLFVEQLLKRERYLGGLTERHLSGCAALVKATGLEESLVATATEESLSQAEQIADHKHLEGSEEQGLSERQVQDLITALQNLAILEAGVEDEDEQSEVSVRLRQLHEKLRGTVPRLPESYRQTLLELVHSEKESEEAPTTDSMAMAGDDNVGEHAVPTTGKLFVVRGADDDAAELLSAEEEPNVMTGIIEDSASTEGNAM